MRKRSVEGVKNVAMIGANKEALKLLPVLLGDKKTRVRLIADPNRDAMLFKLNELGYRLAKALDIKTTHDLNDLKRLSDLDVVINVLQDTPSEKFLESPEFRDMEKLGPLSTRLIWGVAVSARPDAGGKVGANEQTALLTALREIVDAVRLTIDRKELLSVILKLATESTMAERGSIMLISPEEGVLRVEIAKGMDDEVVRKIRVPIGEGVSGKVALEGKSLLISGKTTVDKFNRPMERTDVKSAMCVPLVVNGDIIGVINVSSSESTHIFTNEDLNFLSSLSGLAAEVIHRSNEYERLKVDSAKFSFWKEADSIMASSMPLERRLNEIARKLVEIIPGLTCFIYIQDEDTGRLVLKASNIRDAKGIGLLSLRAGEGIEGHSVESMKDVFLVDRTEHGTLKRIYISLPMLSHGTLVGSFNGQIVSHQGLSVYHETFLKDIRTLIAESVYKHRQGEKEKMKSRKMFAVDESGLEMISIRDIKRLSTIIATTPAAIIGAEGSLLRLKQEGTQRFQTAASYGLDDRKIREYFLPIEKETVMEVLRKKEVVAREFSEEASPYIRSVLAFPLKVEERVAGVLTLFNKTGEASVYPCAFSKTDEEIVARFAVYAEKGLSGALKAAPAQEEIKKKGVEHRPSPMEVFEKRVEEELNRSRRSDKGLVIATVRVTGLKEKSVKDISLFEERLVSAVRKNTRSFDVAIKLNDETYGFIFPEAAERVTRLVDSIIEVITGEEAYEKAFSDKTIDVLWGQASFPRDGDSFGELFSKASRRSRVNLDSSLDPGL